MVSRTEKTPDKAFLDKVSRFTYDPDQSPSKRHKAQKDPSPVGRSTPIPSTSRRSKRRLAGSESGRGGTAPKIPSDQVLSTTPQKATGAKDVSTPPSKRKPRPFAGPEVYAHLSPVTDHLKEDLKCKR